jgi:nucleotide-binding universal stress UspA family protein
MAGTPAEGECYPGGRSRGPLPRFPAEHARDQLLQEGRHARFQDHPPPDRLHRAGHVRRLARALALDADSELLVVHVAPVGHPRKRRQRREMREALHRFTAAERNVRIRSLLLEGAASSPIVCTASQLDCDLIVMGTNERRGLRRLLAGSVAGAVRRDAPCPVVTVRLPAREGGNRWISRIRKSASAPRASVRSESLPRSKREE